MVLKHSREQKRKEARGRALLWRSRHACVYITLKGLFLLSCFACEDPYVRLLDLPDRMANPQDASIANDMRALTQSEDLAIIDMGGQDIGGLQAGSTTAGEGAGHQEGGQPAGVSSTHEAGVDWSDAGFSAGSTGEHLGGSSAGIQTPNLTQLKVHLFYQDRVYDAQGYFGEHIERAIPFIRVLVVDRETWQGAIDQAIPLAEGYTDQTGEVILEGEFGEGDLKLIALSQLDYQGHRAEVRDALDSTSLYVLESESFSLRDTQEMTMNAPAEGILSGAFNILEATAKGFIQLDTYGAEPGPLLTYLWSLGQPLPCGSCYLQNQINLGGQVEDPDHYDDHIILHEMGHFMVDVWSMDDSPGGAHRGRSVSPLLAYGEGVAYFWSALVLQAPLIVDWMDPTPWVVDLESGLLNGVQNSIGVDGYGRHHEELVSSYLWDAYDDHVDELRGYSDQLALGEESIMQILLDVLPQRQIEYLGPGVELADWIEAARCTSPESEWELHQLSVARLYPWSVGSSGTHLETGLLTASRTCLHKEPSPYRLTQDQHGLWLAKNPRYQVELPTPHQVQLKVGIPPKTYPFGQIITCHQLPCLVQSMDDRNKVSFDLPIIAQIGKYRSSWLSEKALNALRTRGGRSSIKHIKKAPFGALWIERSDP